MPLEVLRECDGAFRAQLPPDLQSIKLDKLQMGQDCADRFVQGAVFLRYPPHQLGTMEKVIKLVLEESSEEALGSKQINVFLFGSLVDECEPALQQGVTVAITGFQVSHSPTFSKDGRHTLQLELSEQTGARVFVYEQTLGRPPVTGTKGPIVQRTKDYVYIPLNEVKEGLTVNVYGVVKFFKQPVPSKGTDFYSTLTLVDPSAARLHCVLFSGSLDLLPQIYKVGDVVRFHRLKIQCYEGDLQGVNGPGFSALTFDGALEAGVTPRTASKSYQFTSTDRKIVRELRSWAKANLLAPDTLRLKDIQQNTKYLDLTCQLLAKARLEASTVLLKVWDGTKCQRPIWQVNLDGYKLDGDANAIESLRGLSVDVLVYDNHASTASSLQVGAYLRLHNIHLKLPEGSEVTELHLHGGTSYGRGVSVLPADSHDSKRLQRSLEAAVRNDADSLAHLSLMEALNISTAPAATCQSTNNCQKTKGASKPEQRCQEESAAVLTAHQHIAATALGAVLSQEPPCKYRIRAQLMDFQPRGLHQSVKLHCPACQAWLEIPEREEVDAVLRGVPDLLPSLALCPAPWYQTVTWHSLSPEKLMAAHIVLANGEEEAPESKAILAEGVTVRELHRLSRRFGSVIPVCRRSEQLTLMDCSVPFVIEGRKWHYGCKNCSTPRPVDALQSLPSGEPWKASAIARVLGVQMLHYVFVMKFTLSDGSGSLDALLWDEAEKFFGIPASDVVGDESLQEKLRRILETLCPSKQGPEGYPWLECCIKSYRVRDGSNDKTCFQMFDTIVVGIEEL
ncbi:protection of telomeres protein 1 [Callorhinchus milii]|uniref:protection of telomeres protein 1 n=1 Tax=Callorhinchus milii TaxID=7868 RepID=UPI001C3F5160|nr:protection of telomeres protein 1 [Callorhinchus milii]